MQSLGKHFLRRTNTSLQHPLPNSLESPPTKLKSIQEELEATKMLDQTMTNQMLDKTIGLQVSSEGAKMLD